MNKKIFRKKFLSILKSDKTAKETKRVLIKLGKKYPKEYISFIDNYVEALKKTLPVDVRKNDAYWMWFKYTYYGINF